MTSNGENTPDPQTDTASADAAPAAEAPAAPAAPAQRADDHDDDNVGNRITAPDLTADADDDSVGPGNAVPVEALPGRRHRQPRRRAAPCAAGGCVAPQGQAAEGSAPRGRASGGRAPRGSAA
jgi:hypothetical protein